MAGKPVSVKECRAAEVGDPVATYLQHTEQAAAAALCVKVHSIAHDPAPRRSSMSRFRRPDPPSPLAAHRSPLRV